VVGHDGGVLVRLGPLLDLLPGPPGPQARLRPDLGHVQADGEDVGALGAAVLAVLAGAGLVVRQVQQAGARAAGHEEQALTQRELSERSDVTQATIVHAERGGETRPSTVRKLANALGVAPRELMREGRRDD